MSKIFETERLIIRPFETGDLHDLHQLIYSDPDVCKYYSDRTHSLEEMREWLTYRILETKYSDFHGRQWCV
jgi:RimJ/RimL family protein N-acetyltransferase